MTLTRSPEGLWTSKTECMCHDHGSVRIHGDTPFRVLEPGLRTEDIELIQLMDEHPPNTKFHVGDLAYLVKVPSYLRLRRKTLPLYWKVRFVVSAWAYEIHALAHSPELHRYVEESGALGADHAVSLIEAQDGLKESEYSRPMIYAHAFPHGNYPDTASWFPESALRRVALRELNPDWELILDEAKAPFMGYDINRLVAPFAFDMAPDLYSNGESLGAPFEHEEPTFHTAALLGLEPAMMQPVDPYYVGNPRMIDGEHDVFGSKT